MSSPGSPLIPRDQLASCQFWKLDDFNAPPPASAALMTVEQIERLSEQARSEAYAAGYQEGTATAQAEMSRLRTLMGDLERELNRFDQGLADSMVSLSLEMARQLVRNSLTRHPENVVDVVREAMQAVPPFGEHAHLLLHSDDATLVRAHIGEKLAHAKWRLVEDDSIERGGCRVQTATMRIDGTLPTRWQRMVSALAREDAWYRPSPTQSTDSPETATE